jgi:ATP-dependent DNA helicase DinG
MAALIETALARQAIQPVGILPIEAGTGIGKTLAYIVPGALHAATTGGRILVSTHTIALGEQILRQDGPIAQDVVRRLTGQSITLGHLRGRRHFISAPRALATGNLLKADGAARSVWAPYLDAAEIGFSMAAAAEEILSHGQFDGDHNAIIDACLLDHIENRYGLTLSKSEISLLSSSAKSDLAVYRLSREIANRGTVLITTHAYTAISLARRALLPANSDPFTLLVIDEADQWASAASSVSLISVSLHALLESLEDLRQSVRHLNNTSEISDAVSKAVDHISDLSRFAPKVANKKQQISEKAVELVHVDRLVSTLDIVVHLAARRRSQTAAAVDALQERTDDIKRIVRAISQNENRFWAPRWTTSRLRANPSLSLAGRAPGRLLKRLWIEADGGGLPMARTILLTSATLGTPGFSDASRWAAIENATGADLSSGRLLADLAMSLHPKEFGRLRVRFADPRAPVPRIGNTPGQDVLSPAAAIYASRVVSEAMKASAAARGRTLVLVPSYSDANELGRVLARQAIDVLIHKQGVPTHVVLGIYREMPGCCLITPGAWVGADLPGLIQNLVITRVPYPPSDPGEQAVFVQVLSETLTKLSQGIGRAIRTETDDVTLWFADPRIPIPDCVVEETGLLPSVAAKTVLLSAIPTRFRQRFGVDPDAAAIGVPYAALDDYTVVDAAGSLRRSRPSEPAQSVKARTATSQ